jgi:hypothetical protein
MLRVTKAHPHNSVSFSLVLENISEGFEAKNSFLMRFRSLPTIPLFRAWTSRLATFVRQCVDCSPLSCFLLEPRPR